MNSEIQSRTLNNGFSSPCANGTVVSSLQGLTYTLYCDWTVNGDDFGTDTDMNFQQCVDSCTNNRPACYAAVWDPDSGTCSRRHGGSPDVLRGLVAQAGFRSVVVNATQMADRQSVAEQQCPYPNLSQQETTDGMEFRIFCGSYILGSETSYSFHTTTMNECMEKCAENHPLCDSFSFNSDMAGSGWLNCLIRSGSNAIATPYTRTLAHSAILIDHPLEMETCHNETLLVADDDRLFRTSCSDLRKLNDTTTPPVHVSHEKSLAGCLQACTAANSTCKTAVFDNGLQQGFQNCYLFNDFPPVGVRDPNATFVYLDSMSSQYRSPPLDRVKSRNPAWIAGPVVGSVAGFVLLIALILYWYKRKTAKNHPKYEKIN